MKATLCGLENRSSDPGKEVRNEIIVVMERFAESGCNFLPTFRDSLSVPSSRFNSSFIS